jgi:hypothetical protein
MLQRVHRLLGLLLLGLLWAHYFSGFPSTNLI